MEKDDKQFAHEESDTQTETPYDCCWDDPGCSEFCCVDPCCC